MIVPPREPQQNNNNNRQEHHKRTWIRKQNQYSNEECTLTLQDQQKKRGWYVDSGCSKHMIGDRDRFLTLRKEIYVSVSFGNDDSAKSLEKAQSELGTRISREKMLC